MGWVVANVIIAAEFGWARAFSLRALLVFLIVAVISFPVGQAALSQGVIDRGAQGQSDTNLQGELQRQGDLPGSEPALDPSDPLPSDPSVLRSVDQGASQMLRLEIGDRVFFADGSAALGSRARLVLVRQAYWLKPSKAKIAVVGHGDDSGRGAGGEAADLEISLRRAVAVRDRLIEEGLAAERILVVPMGRKKRIAVCSDSLCRTQNRRAVTVILRDGANNEQ